MFGITTATIRQYRLSKCLECKYLGGWILLKWIDQLFGTSYFIKCNLCHCFIKTKTKLTTAKCPKKYW